MRTQQSRLFLIIVL